MLIINSRIKIPLREFDFSYVRSSGPGGQNVNKVATKVILKWNVYNSKAISEAVRIRFIDKFLRKINNNGEVIVKSDRFRDQARNIADTLEKLHAMLLEAAYPPKKRIATKPSKASIEKRLEAKKKQSKKKAYRKKVLD